MAAKRPDRTRDRMPRRNRHKCDSISRQRFPLCIVFSLQVTSMPLPPMQYIKAYEETPLAAPPFGRSAASQAAAGGKRAFPSPPPPITDAYTMFGAPFSADDTIIQTLESQVNTPALDPRALRSRSQNPHSLSAGNSAALLAEGL